MLPDTLTPTVLRGDRRELFVLNLGAGVQSTALALMSHRQVVPQHVPLFDVAIFADTGEEPDEVYRHLEWLIKEVEPSFPVIVRTAGKLGDDLVHGNRFDLADGGRFASIPAFTTDEEGKPGGMTRRQCSKEYKTAVVERAIRRECLGLAHRQRVPVDRVVHMYLGLSFDEGRRIFGHSGKPGAKERIEANRWARAHFPLYDMFLTRPAIRSWLERYGIPHQVPRSACVFCPYHSNAEWRRIKEEDPKGWARAVEIDEAMRSGAFCAKGLEQALYLHRTCVPLAEADLTIPDPLPHQQDINFSVLECEGVCGL